MRPENLTTRIFLDSGDPNDTKEILDLLGFIDGQTTNPSLIAKNPAMQEKMAGGEALSSDEVKAFYKDVIQEIAGYIPGKSVSIEVYADANTTTDEILTEAREMREWIDSPHIKLPITAAGLEAAEVLTSEGTRVNLTLCFSQEQAAAVYAATKGAQRGDVFLSPFVGRLDDKGMDGLSLIKNIAHLYETSDLHTEVLVASIRSLDHLLYAIAMEADLATVPKNVLIAWAEAGMPVPTNISEVSVDPSLHQIPYEQLDLESSWQSFNIQHDLTDAGLQRFADDWNALIGK